MSSIIHRQLVQDGGSHSHPASVSAIRNNSSHVSLGQASMTDHCGCPYDDKVVTSGTTARMVLMFMRDLVEPPGNQARQCYACPMRECRKAFNEPLPLIQHLLTCPDLLRGGIFDCDKCNAWHQVPTNEKDWEQWSGWRSHPAPFQRKRSFSSKMRETFTIRRKDSSRKANASPEPHIDHGYSLNIRMGSLPIEQQRGMANGVCPEHHVIHPTHRPVPDFLGPQKILPDLDRNMFWPGMVDDISELHSASSIAPSSFETEPSQPASTNTSQTTLYTSTFPNYAASTPSAHSRDHRLPAQQYPLFSPHSAFSSEPRSSTMSSAMSIDEPLTVTEPALSPNEIGPVTSNNNQSWWPPKTGPDVQTLTPVSSSCFPIQSPVCGMMTGDTSGEITAPTSPCTSPGMEDRNATPGPQYYPMQHASMDQHTMSRALSHESMHGSQITNLYELGLSDAHNISPLSPQSPHTHHMGMHGKSNADSPTEELMCDECQWKPRGVRENLKGYLRKHKNTHKGLRLACEVPGCTKTFSRLDNLKKHKKDKHGMSDDGPSILPSRRVADEYTDHMEDDPDKRPSTSDSRLRAVVMAEDYSMLWPALHF
ncbi:hypothetical protein V8F33_007668 [Rhypophila sp. PSN 637]